MGLKPMLEANKLKAGVRYWLKAGARYRQSQLLA